MFITSFFRSCRGYVRFKCEGDRIAEFITIAAKRGYKIWTGKRINQKLYAYTYAKQYKEVAHLARETENRTQIVSRKGIPFFVSRYKKRLGFGLGILLFILFLLFMQNFIWSIEVVGNDMIQTEKILSIAEEYGIKIGAYKAKLDFESIQGNMRIKLENVAWISINSKGSDITIELKETTDREELIDNEDPCNITAKKDGKVIRMNVKAGLTSIQKDDYVAAGDLLVSGIYEDKYGNTIYRHSQAEIIAQIEIEKTFRIKAEQEEKTLTGNEKNKYKLNIAGLKIPLHLPFEPYDTYDIKTTYLPFKIAGYTLPFGRYQTTYMETLIEQKSFTEEEANEKLTNVMEEYEQTELDAITIITKDMNYSMENDMYILQVFYLCEEDIAQKEKILLQD